MLQAGAVACPWHREADAVNNLCRAEDQLGPTAPLPWTVLVGRGRTPECDLHQRTHSSPAWTWICPEEQGMKNTHSGGAQ